MARPHIAARFEDSVRRRIESRLRGRGWHERVAGYTGYGSTEKARVFARVTLSRTEPEERRTALTHAQDSLLDIAQRGWRVFLTAPAGGVRVTVRMGEATVTATSDRGGYVDVDVPGHGLGPGWREATIGLDNGDSVTVSVMVVDPEAELGLVSDIDDTVMITHLPRMFIAGWNTFVRSEQVRQRVPGMGSLYRAIAAEDPRTPVFYLSTGAWNTAPALTRFLRRHDFPVGPLLLTDWGPTNTGWFRSGQEHKERELRRLAEEFPRIRWILVGDDGQHDPVIYGEFAQEHPDRVLAICLRELTPAEQLLSSGLPVATDELLGKRADVPMLKASNGYGLHQLLMTARGTLAAGGAGRGPLAAGDADRTDEGEEPRSA
ncbi:App1 family protein [Ornithinimicrobium humiphilum]|uniref:Phosphatidate phosphatase APP1 n=1 Tax=Ornithinimicrobium humiphilum TaxID=125288 RepID=A0A543KJS5_9MICO|nr:phosphatase domain-containing protein [Ornithinimicrobium humiphilum]TQM95331.1 phosphatidate phosphatase APP1 [Ornithinimicrobium humiphilum]